MQPTTQTNSAFAFNDYPHCLYQDLPNDHQRQLLGADIRVVCPQDYYAPPRDLLTASSPPAFPQAPEEAKPPSTSSSRKTTRSRARSKRSAHDQNGASALYAQHFRRLYAASGGRTSPGVSSVLTSRTNTPERRRSYSKKSTSDYQSSDKNASRPSARARSASRTTPLDVPDDAFQAEGAVQDGEPDDVDEPEAGVQQAEDETRSSSATEDIPVDIHGTVTLYPADEANAPHNSFNEAASHPSSQGLHGDANGAPNPERLTLERLVLLARPSYTSGRSYLPQSTSAQTPVSAISPSEIMPSKPVDMVAGASPYSLVQYIRPLPQVDSVKGLHPLSSIVEKSKESMALTTPAPVPARSPTTMAPLDMHLRTRLEGLRGQTPLGLYALARPEHRLHQPPPDTLRALPGTNDQSLPKPTRADDQTFGAAISDALGKGDAEPRAEESSIRGDIISQISKSASFQRATSGLATIPLESLAPAIGQMNVPPKKQKSNAATSSSSNKKVGSDTNQGPASARGKRDRKTAKPAGPFRCSWAECAKAFASKESKDRHEKSHTRTEERPYVCDHPGCTGAFFRSDHLRTHQRRVHLRAATIVSTNSEGNEATRP